MDSKHKKANLDLKLNTLFYELRATPDFSFEDDTVMQKLQSSLGALLKNKEDQIIWSKRVGLIELIKDSLSEKFITNGKISSIVTFSLGALSSLLSQEECFVQLTEDKILCNFLKALPLLRKNMSFSCAALKVTYSMLSHTQGSDWTFKNGLWEGILFPCLESQNIFVQKQCVQTACSYLLKADSALFTRCIQDLELLRIKFQELNHTLRRAQEENANKISQFAIKQACLDTSNKTVLLIYNELLIQTLGKQPMYTQLRSAMDLTTQILFSLNQEESSEIVRLLSRMLLLSALHKFQEQLLKFGTAEQYHLDSMASDLLSLMKHMINIGRFTELTLASFSLHKYWSIMCKNLRDHCDAELSKGLSILYMMARLQIIPINSIYASTRVFSTPDDDSTSEQNYISLITKWNIEAYEQMDIRQEHKDLVKQLEDKVIDHYKQNRQEADRFCISCFLEGHAILDYLHHNTAMILFGSAIFLIHFNSKASNLLHCNPRLMQLAIDGLRILVDKFSIDWKKCWLSVCSLELLCDVVWIPGMTSQVKVSTLQAMASCVRNFIPPAMSALVKVEVEMDSSLLLAGKVLPIYLSDSDWEVRDSALEFVALCMRLAKNEYPFFVDWILKLNLIEGVLFAVGDAEPYVQASSLTVIGSFVHLSKIWEVIKVKGIKQYAFRSVLKAGDSIVRVAGLHLLKSLYSASKFSDIEIKDYLLPVIQKTTADIDDEIRALALDFINLHLENELMCMGMVDGHFPRVTFYKGKITQLQETDIKSLVLSVVSWFCRNGYCSSVISCLRDPAERVSSKAFSILKFVCSLVSNYNLKHDLEWMSGSSFSVDKQNNALATQGKRDHRDSTSADENKMDVEEDASSPSAENQSPATEENISQGIDYVLNTPDLDVLSRLPNIQYNPASPLWWWNGDITSHPLTAEELPPKQPAVSSLFLFREMDNLTTDRKELQDEPKGEERDLLLLLEDIFLDAGPISATDDQRARDCY